MSRHRHVDRLVKGALEEYDDEDDEYYDDQHASSSSSSSSAASRDPYLYNRNAPPAHSAAHFTTKPAKAKAAKPARAKPAAAALPPPHPTHVPHGATAEATATHSRNSSIPAGFNAGDYADDDYIPPEADGYDPWEGAEEEEQWEDGEGDYDEYDSAVTYKQPAPTAANPKHATKATPPKSKPSAASATASPARPSSPFSAAAPPKPTATPPPNARLRTAAEEAETAAAVNALRLEKLKLSNSPSLQRVSSASSQADPPLIRSFSPAPSTPTSASASASTLPSGSPGVAILRTSSSTEQLAMIAQHKRQQSRLAQIEAEEKASKPTLNVVVIGHVDAGKSTLMGHLLLLMGVVSAKLLHKYEKDSRALGKASFHFAWVLDQQDEERQRGITVDVAVSHFATPTKNITLLDAPGHRDFIPNMIAGTAQADVAVLVVPAVVGEFESGFVEEGQIREHAMLAKSMGVGQLVVAVNKCDAVEWSEERYKQILTLLLPFLKATGYKEKDITTVPVSGLTGENITACGEARLSSWYSGPTLLAAIDSLTPPKRPVDRPFRCCVTEVFRSQSLGVTVAGRVDSGAVIKGDSVLVLPQNETVSVRGVEVNGEPVAVGKVGENVEVGLKDVTDPALLIPGSWLCDPLQPIPLTQRFRAQVLTTALSRVLMSGTACIMYTQSAVEEVTLSQLVSVLDSRDGRVTQSKPRFLGKGVTALVEVTCKRQVCVELYREYRELGRFSLRRGTETVAVGIVQEIL